MTGRLDHLVTRLAEAPTDRALDGFGAEILRDIAQRRTQARAAVAMAPVGAAGIAFALLLGVTVGSLTAVGARPSVSSFSMATALAPSTLLEGPR
jgi:hypothetical protein